MKKIALLICLCVTYLASVSLCLAEDGYPDDLMDKIMAMKADAEIKKDMPATVPGATVVTTAEVQKLYKEKKVVFLDNRIKTQYAAEHIKDAQLFFTDDLLNDPAKARALDKEKEYLLYCNGTHCWRSPAAAMMLGHLGFKKLYWYRDGIPAWKKAGGAVE